jgi:hypothetical protein
MMGTYLSFYFYFFLKAKTQISALVEFTESFLQYQGLHSDNTVYYDKYLNAYNNA